MFLSLACDSCCLAADAYVCGAEQITPTTQTHTEAHIPEPYAYVKTSHRRQRDVSAHSDILAMGNILINTHRDILGFINTDAHVELCKLALDPHFCLNTSTQTGNRHNTARTHTNTQISYCMLRCSHHKNTRSQAQVVLF